eukprot:scaffold274917_cov32-Tisochrysis_lutea.AAC.2
MWVVELIKPGIAARDKEAARSRMRKQVKAREGCTLRAKEERPPHLIDKVIGGLFAVSNGQLDGLVESGDHLPPQLSGVGGHTIALGEAGRTPTSIGSQIDRNRHYLPALCKSGATHIGAIRSGAIEERHVVLLRKCELFLCDLWEDCAAAAISRARLSRALCPQVQSQPCCIMALLLGLLSVA